ncbi:MAG TPA: cytochrome c biogenesis protein CcsA [Tepidisphaeraceae bacterium]|nr:cytochrome c biogenesis protein CcsA [Tepidisphaeraceae bacterium]
MLKKILAPFASLTLTVVLLSAAMVLIYAGTWAQVDTGIWEVQKKYFHSWFCWIEIGTLLPRPQPGAAGLPWWFGFPFIGGYTLGVGLLVNLLAAHTLRFQFERRDWLLLPPLGMMVGGLFWWTTHPEWHWMTFGIVGGVAFLLLIAWIHGKRAGVITIHLGLILLLLGEGVSSKMQVESQMRIDEGSSANYSEDIRTVELAIVERGPVSEPDTHAVIDRSLLLKSEGGKEQKISRPGVPLDVTVHDYYRNSKFVDAARHPDRPSLSDRAGAFTLEPRPVIGGVKNDDMDLPGAFVTVSKAGNAPQRLLLRASMPAQGVRVTEPGPDGKPVEKVYEVSLRFKRLYKDYTIALKDFTFDRYTGTSTARNFSSQIVLTDPVHNETRDVRVWMNNPLRYRGETFFQQGFDNETEKTTVLQIVYNPGYLLPYMAIVIAGFGLIDHFVMVLTAFLLRRSLTKPEVLVGHIGVLGLLAAGFAAHVLLGYHGILFVAAALGIFITVLIVWHVRTRSAHEAGKAARDAAIVAAARARAAGGKGAKPQAAAVDARTAQSGTRRIEMKPESRFLTARFLVPLSFLVLCLIYVVAHARPKPIAGSPAYDALSKAPVSFDGRVQPIDTLARNALKVLRGRESALHMTAGPDGNRKETSIAPVPWLLDVVSGKSVARDYKTLEIDDLDLKNMMALPRNEKFFSPNDLGPNWHKLVPEMEKVGTLKKQGANLSHYQRAVDELSGRLSLWNRLAMLDTWFVVPPSQTTDADRPGEWQSFGDIALRPGNQSKKLSEFGFEVLRQFSTTPEGRFRPRETPGRWITEAMLYPAAVNDDEVFSISNPELATALGLDPKQVWYSMNQIRRTKPGAMASLLNDAMHGGGQDQTPLQAAVNDLARKIDLYRQISEAGQMPEVTRQIPKSADAFVRLLRAHKIGNAEQFATAVADYEKAVRPSDPPGAHDASPSKAAFETWFNRFSPFVLSTVFYVIVLVLALVGWALSPFPNGSRVFLRSAFWVLGLTVLVHAFALIGRIYISGRPPVTNLASSAMFIGFGAAVFGIILELLFRNGVGSVAAALVAFPSLMIASQLSLSGDTMAVLVAVLDTNVWLATHVVTITLGYAATFLAGVLGIIYIIRGIFTKGQGNALVGVAAAALTSIPGAAIGMTVNLKTLGRMIYGITCFAIVMSFVGTILGGIWADQSWGRFWGWDPKENGAVLIVLANALVLHARWGGLVKERGIAVLAIFGNIVTAWSWFGTNMLGVGLHSYGFMSSALAWLLAFVATQFALIVLGCIPMSMWRSYQPPATAPQAVGGRKADVDLD